MPCKLTPYEWACYKDTGEFKACNDKRALELHNIECMLRTNYDAMNKVMLRLRRKGAPFTASDVLDDFLKLRVYSYFFSFMENLILETRLAGKERLSECYASSLRSFKRYRCGLDIPFEDINTEVLEDYERYLQSVGVCSNTISFYMRNLRAVYNRAVDKGFTEQRMPFRHVYTGVDHTHKRALTLEEIRRIKEIDLTDEPVLGYVRDLFMLSFYLRGMSFVDLAYLKKSDISGNMLVYERSKTKQTLFIKWEPCMQQIVDRYAHEATSYLLPIIRDEMLARQQYLSGSNLANRMLKIIGRRLGFPLRLTMYVARHSWATIAKNESVPIAVISECLGHDSEKTTRIYLSSFSDSRPHDANSKILALL